MYAKVGCKTAPMTDKTQAEEAVSPELDARMIESRFDRETALAYADWLDERGDPRGTLIRLQSTAGEYGAAVDWVSQHWERWFGACSPKGLQCQWNYGFVRSLEVWGLAGTELPELLARRSLHFLQTLEVWAREHVRSLGGLKNLPLLRHLTLFEPSEPTIRSLTFQAPPALRRVSVIGALTEESLDAALEIPWLGRLESLELGPLDETQAEHVCSRVELLAGTKAPLHLDLTKAAVISHRDRLRTLFPGIKLRIHRDQGSRVPRRNGHWGNAAPGHAPKDFRSLAPSTHVDRSGRLLMSQTDSPYVGSGVPFSEHPLAKGEFDRCMACAGDDTLCIYANHSASYSRRNCETSVWFIVEYLCRECGAFSSYQRSYEY